jgi:hypothetical protein
VLNKKSGNGDKEVNGLRIGIEGKKKGKEIV